MPITPEQRLERRKHLGSSDSPKVCGVDPWENAADVWIQKVYGTEDAPSEQKEIGNWAEPMLVEWAAAEVGMELRPPVSLVHPGGIFAANLDGLGLKNGKPAAVIEAKSTSMSHEWGEEGTDQVPERVLVQTGHQLYASAGLEKVADLEVVYVPVLMAKFDRLIRRLYVVKRSERLEKAIVERGTEFWQGNVVPRIPPSGALPSLDVLERLQRTPAKVAMVDPALYEAYERARLEAKAADEDKEAAKAALLAAAGDAEALDFGDPTHWLTYYERHRSGVDGKRLRAEKPALFAAFEKISTYRQLTLQKRKR